MASADSEAVSLTFDYREHALIAARSNAKQEYQTANLPVGDIELRKGAHVMLIERKTWSDLAASIKDGRWREQKMRLRAANAGFYAIIVEGSLRNGLGLPCSTLMSTVWNTLLRDRFPVVQTRDINQTVEWIDVLVQIWTRLTEQELSHWHVAQDVSYLEALSGTSVTKKENIGPDNAMVLMLAQLPNVSVAVAECIQRIWPDWMTFMDALRDSSSVMEALSNMNVSTTDKPRRWGSKRAEQLVSLLVHRVNMLE